MSRDIYRKSQRSGLVSADIVRPRVNDLTELYELAPSDIWDGSLILVQDTSALYFYDRESEYTPDGVTIILPVTLDDGTGTPTGAGRWLKVGFGGSASATSGSADRWVDVTKLLEDEVITVDKTSNSDWPQEVRREVIDVTESGAVLNVVDGYVISAVNESLAETLGYGNVTGGTDIEVTAGDNVLMHNNAPPTTGAGQGSFFVGDGTGTTIAGQPYFREENDGAVHKLNNAAGGESLAGTLAIGNTTGGTNIVVSSSDEIQGQTDLVLRPGTDGNLDLIIDGAGQARLYTAAASPDIVFLQMGENQETGLGHVRPGAFGPNGVLVVGPKDTTTPLDIASGSTTNDLFIASTSLQTNTAGAGVGSGSVTLRSGSTSFVSPGTAAGNTGTCEVGSGNVSTGNAQTGTVRVSSGGTEGDSGDVTVESGVASGSNATSGMVTVRSGEAASGTSGDLVFETGTSSSDATRGTVRVEGAGLEIKSASPSVASHGASFRKLVVSNTGTGYTLGGLYLVDSSGSSFLIDRALDVERINMPESPGNTVEFHGWVPRACRLVEVKAMMTTLNTVGNLNLAVNSGGNSLLSGANFNLNGLSAANTVNNISLTGTSAHLLFAADQVWTLSIESTDVGMDGEGIYIQLVWEVGP